MRVATAAGDDEAMRALVDQARAAEGLSAAQRLALLEAEADWRLASDPDPETLAPLMARLRAEADAAEDPRPALRLLARIHAESGDVARAAALRGEVVAHATPSLADRLAWAEALYAAERPEQARARLEAAWAQAGSLGERIAVAGAWRPAPGARATNPYIAKLRAQHPEDHRVSVAAAESALQGERPAEAVALLEQAEKQAPEGARPAIRERAEAVHARRRAVLAGGYDLATVPGVPGISDRRLETAMLEWRHPVFWDDQFVLKLDYTRMDVGQLDVGDALDFGQFATVPAAGRAGFFPQAPAEADGLGVGLGYESDNWRADIGTTPLGFPEPFLVGGLRYSGRLGGHQWQAGVSRRAVTSTFLSYAGDRDPVSGRFWGAARADGLSLSLARYAARYSYSFSVYPHRVTGRNIPENTGVIAQASGSREIFARPWVSLSLGGFVGQWFYERNQRFYTFGHGGYYSPQSYTTLSIPLYAQGRVGRFSYSAQVGAAYTYSREDDADFYPGRPDLQAAARAAGEDPVYRGGSGGGASVQLEGSLEYALTEHFGIGARYAINRADFYEPNFLSLYLRHNLGSGTPNIRVPPQRVSPYREW